MREGRVSGGVDGEGGVAAAPMGAFRPRRQPQSNPSSSGSAASSSSGRGDAEEKKQGRRKSKKREEVVRAIRDRLPAAPSCWGNASVGQGRSRRERPVGVGRGRDAVEENDSGAGAGTAASPSWCCVCPDGDCSMEANPSVNGKEDPAIRSLIELNDFYSDDCNPHAAAPAAVIVESPAADFD